ncbi:MAG: hypothetical protein H7Z42_07180 [Roseiflexaceae bacterium]|nr:hypothetical protein [Roseiflexaceae bacterium]
MTFAERELIGRDALLAELAPHVVAQRLLTLIGPGGVGKTSIAQQLARDCTTAAVFAGGVHWVDLAALSEGTAVPQAVAAAWGLAEQRGTSWLETLVAALHATQALLVLDTCEHLHDPCRTLCVQLLAACPQLHILATSRKPLGLDSEMRVPIPPLDAPDAVALFRLRATARLASFTANDNAALTIATICTQLDGVPLAIELAAARVTLLSVAQIAEHMGRSLGLLASREPALPLRQRSLRGALEWSYTLLNSNEQALFCQLSVFAGSFDFAAVEAVCLVSAPLDALAELVDASLVMVTPDDQTMRYRLHEVARQYAAERLAETGQRMATRVRQLAWAVALGERAERTFDVARQDAWLAQLVLEHENIRSALQTAEETGDADAMLRLASALVSFWNSVSISEGRNWLARGRARAPVEPRITSAKAWNSESFLAYRQGDYDGMHRAASAALTEALTLEYAAGIADARYRLGIYAEMKGAPAEARIHYQQSLDLYRELGDRRGTSQILNGLAHIAKNEGDFSQARQYYGQGLAIARADGDRLTTALLLISLANLMLDTNELVAAEAAYAESLAHLRAIDHPSYQMYAINGLGEVAHYRQDFATANERYREGLQMARDLGAVGMAAQFLVHLGHTAINSADHTEAADCLSEGLRLYLQLKRTHRIAGTIHFCAYLVVRLGYPAQATALFVAGLRAVQAEDFAYLGNDAALLANASATARAALTPTEYALSVADGEMLNMAQAAELALSAVYLPQRPLPSAPPPELQIFLFGRLRVVCNGRELTGDDWVYSKTKDLLLFLLLVDSADKAEIGAALWPDASAEQLKQNFRMAVYHLRRALGRAEWIIFDGGRYAFNRTLHSWLDVAAFEQALASSPAQRGDHLRTAAALYTGDMTCGELESDLVLIRRERLHQQALEVLLALGEMHLSNGHYIAAADAYHRAIALDTYGEAAQRGVMRSLARQGEGGAALAHYAHFAELLAQDLGVAPTPETATLAAQIQAGTVL